MAGGTNSMKGKVVDTKNHSAVKRTTYHSNIKERQTPELGKRYVEPRCFYWIMSSSSTPLQHADNKNSSAPTLQVIKSPSSPLSLVSPGTPTDESKDVSNSISPVSSSGMENFAQSGSSHSFDEPLQSPSSISSSSYLVPVNSSTPVSENANADSSYISPETTVKSNGTLKKSSHRKGKRKGKQCNKIRSNKVSAKPDIDSSCVGSVCSGKNSFNKQIVGDSFTADDQRISNNETADCLTSLISCDTHLSSSMNNSSSSLLESFHDSRNISKNCSTDTEMGLIAKEGQPINSSNCEVIPSSKRLHTTWQTPAGLCNLNTNMPVDKCINVACWPSNALDPFNIDERAACSSQASSSSNFDQITSEKRGRRSRKMSQSGNLNGASRSGQANKHMQFGKDNNHSVWQKVEKIVNRPRTGNVGSTSPQCDSVCQHSNMKLKGDSFVNMKEMNYRKCRYLYSDGSQTYNKEPQQLRSNSCKTKTPVNPIVGDSVGTVKSKSSLAWTESSNSFRKKPNASVKDIIQNSVAETSLSYKKSTNISEVRETSNKKSTSVSEVIECVLLEEATPIRINSMSVSKSFHDPVSQIGLLQTGADSRILSHSDCNIKDYAFVPDVHMHADVSSSLLEHKPSIQVETSNSAEVGSLKSITDAQFQQSTPLERTKSTDNISVINTSTLSHMNKKPRSQTIDNNVEEDISTTDKNETLFPPSLASSKYVECSTSGSANDACTSESHNFSAKSNFGSHTTLNLGSIEVNEKEDPSFDTDLEKISQAVIDTCKMHAETEDNRPSSGSPAANFETFLSSASPVLSMPSHSVHIESSCSFCQNQIPNFSLKSLWQWYEEPGCFGLEVKVHENNNLRWSFDSSSEFNAYFVPYLSAVQLFGNSRSGSCCKPAIATAVSPKVDMTSNTTSSSGSLPTFSTGLPQSQKEVCRCVSGLPSCMCYEFLNQSVKSNDIIQEVEFEYFESDQPRWRQPLFEKLKGLASGHKSLNSRISGDPKKLEYLNLHDLHHASWYSVAWYPIYRIPDGKFRASFLTYHSLGHLVQGSRPSSTGAISCVVAPVVGLQTYNDRGESWCQPRGSSELLQTGGALHSNSLELIDKRLRSLEHTAALMSRAVVSKDKKRSVNRHPDYEFFLSRGR